MKDELPYDEKERRRHELDQAQTRILKQLNARLEGQEVEVLVEGQKKGRWFGRTRTDRLVFFSAEGDWLGRIARLKVTWTGPWSLIGEPILDE